MKTGTYSHPIYKLAYKEEMEISKQKSIGMKQDGFKRISILRL